MKPRTNPHPTRQVVNAVLGPPQDGPLWLLTLECGHEVIRYARIRPGDVTPTRPLRAHCAPCTFTGPRVGRNAPRPPEDPDESTP